MRVTHLGEAGEWRCYISNLNDLFSIYLIRLSSILFRSRFRRRFNVQGLSWEGDFRVMSGDDVRDLE